MPLKPEKFSPDDQLTLAEAVKLIVSRVQEDGEDKEKVRNRVDHFIRDHAKKGKLRIESNGTCILKYLIMWAKKKEEWSSKFDDLPAYVNIRSSFTISYSYNELILADNIEACHVEIKKGNSRISELKTENNALKRDAEHYRHWCKANKKNAQKKRYL